MLHDRLSEATVIRDVTYTKSESVSIRHCFQNPKSIGYAKSDHVGFKIFVSAQLYTTIVSLNNSTLIVVVFSLLFRKQSP